MTSSKPLPKCVLDACTPFTKVIYNSDLPPYFFGAVPQNYLRCCLQVYSPHFARNKLNSQLSHCAFFSVDTCEKDMNFGDHRIECYGLNCVPTFIC